MTAFKLGELFCGPGGLAWAAKNACVDGFSISHQWANDYDEATCETYVRNICPENPESVVCADIKKLDLRELYKFGEIDAFCFGFPCNDFSVVGEQKIVGGDFGALYKYGVQVLRDCQPQWFLAENVGGLKSANEGKAFVKIKEDLRNAGYRIYPNLYKFEQYGVPQARHRMIIVGIRADMPFDFKIPSTKPFENADISCRSAIENPPIAANAANNERTKQSAAVVEKRRIAA